MTSNDLDQLLRLALKQKRQRDALVVMHPKRQDSPRERYQNPLNWTEGQLVELIYDDGTAMYSLGQFREFHYKLAPGGRRLERRPTTDTSATFEFCYGEWWITPRHEEPPTFVDDDPEAIRQRFVQLLEEFD